jgi:Icc protein
MVIVQISDTHISLDESASEPRLDNLRRTVTAINQLVPQPDAVVHTGDLANRGKVEEYAAASQLLQELRAPLYLTVGNRDDRTHLQAAFVPQSCFPGGEPFVQYAVEDHALRLLVLDTQGQGRAGDYCERRAAGLLKAFSDQPDKPVAVFLHHPPFDIPGADEAYKFQFESHEAAKRLTDVLDRFGKVVQIFCGHAHRATKTQIKGIPASSIASTAVDLRVGDNVQIPSLAPLFHIHHYDAERGFETTSKEAA